MVLRRVFVLILALSLQASTLQAVAAGHTRATVSSHRLFSTEVLSARSLLFSGKVSQWMYRLLKHLPVVKVKIKISRPSSHDKAKVLARGDLSKRLPPMQEEYPEFDRVWSILVRVYGISEQDRTVFFKYVTEFLMSKSLFGIGVPTALGVAARLAVSHQLSRAQMAIVWEYLIQREKDPSVERLPYAARLSEERSFTAKLLTIGQAVEILRSGSELAQGRSPTTPEQIVELIRARPVFSNTPQSMSAMLALKNNFQTLFSQKMDSNQPFVVHLVADRDTKRISGQKIITTFEVPLEPKLFLRIWEEIEDELGDRILVDGDQTVLLPPQMFLEDMGDDVVIRMDYGVRWLTWSEIGNAVLRKLLWLPEPLRGKELLQHAMHQLTKLRPILFIIGLNSFALESSKNQSVVPSLPNAEMFEHPVMLLVLVLVVVAFLINNRDADRKAPSAYQRMRADA